MGDMNKKTLEELQQDFDKIASKGAWTDAEYERMKNLQKIMYYMEVRCAMKEGQGYPGSEYMDDTDMSFRRGRNMNNGRYMSRDGGSGMHYPPYMDGNSWANGGNGNWDMNASGRRYYDSEKEKAIHKLHHMMENEDNAEKKNALKLAITELEQR